MTFTNLLIVMIGGAIGAGCRYSVTEILKPSTSFATWAVNIIGSLLIGITAGWIITSHLSPEGKNTLTLFLMTGILGGFTTFSSFSLDCYKFIQAGQIITAIIYIASSIAIGLTMTAIGYLIGKNFN